MNFTWDTGGINGDLTLLVNDTGGFGNNLTRDFTVDNNDPSVDDLSPADSGFTKNDDDLDVSFSASDDHTSVKYTNISIFSESESETDTDLTGLELSDGEYTVNYYTLDTVGNSNNESWTFTVDTSYDGDSSPELPSGKYQLLDEDESLDFDVVLDQESEDSDITVTCYDGDDDSIDSATKSVDSDDTTFTCEVDGDDYADTETEVYVEMCDEAGNCKESDTETYVFDGSKPLLSKFKTFGNVVNGDFPVQFEASDLSGVAELEYFFDDEDLGEGEGTSINVSEASSEFEAGIGDIGVGDHTLYGRVRDNAGRWSSKKSIDVEYDPDATPEVSLTLPSNTTVTAGESKSFDVTVKNTGDLYIENSTLEVSSEVVSGSEQVTDLKLDGSQTSSFEVSTGSGDLGKYEVKVSMNYPELEESFSLVVEANQQQKNNISSTLEEYEEKLEKLESRFSENRKGWKEDLRQRFQSNFSSFKKKVENAQQAENSGKYYAVSSTLDGINSEYRSAQQSFEKVKEIDSKRDTRRMLMIGGGVFFLVLLGAGGFLFWSDEYGIDVESLKDSDIDVTGFEALKSRVKTIFAGEEEAEEFEWDGFQDY